MVAALALAPGSSGVPAQERAPDPRLLEELGIMIMHFGLDVRNNKIDAILSRFGFGCLTEPPIGTPCQAVDTRLVNMLRELPADVDAIARALGALGATCAREDDRLDCVYERHVVTTGWAAGYPGPLGRTEELLRVDMIVTTDGKLLSYYAKFRRLDQ